MTDGTCDYCGEPLDDDQEDYHRLCWACWRTEDDDDTTEGQLALVDVGRGPRRERCPVCGHHALTVTSGIYGDRVHCANFCPPAAIHAARAGEAK